MPSTTTLDLVTTRDDGSFVLYLVEEGPWGENFDDELRRIQGRLYDYLDIAIEGVLAQEFPESQGCPVIIRVDAYDTPIGLVDSFVSNFAKVVFNSNDWASAIENSRFVQSIQFECSEARLSAA